MGRREGGREGGRRREGSSGRSGGKERGKEGGKERGKEGGREGGWACMSAYLAGGDTIAEEDAGVRLSDHYTGASCAEGDGGVLREGKREGGREEGREGRCA